MKRGARPDALRTSTGRADHSHQAVRPAGIRGADPQYVTLAAPDRLRLFPQICGGEPKQRLVRRSAQQRQDLGYRPTPVGVGELSKHGLVRAGLGAGAVGEEPPQVPAAHVDLAHGVAPSSRKSRSFRARLRRYERALTVRPGCPGGTDGSSRAGGGIGCPVLPWRVGQVPGV